MRQASLGVVGSYRSAAGAKPTQGSQRGNRPDGRPSNRTPTGRVSARLAVFAGGGTRAAVEAVCWGGPIEANAVFELLAGLVAKSLVVAHREAPETRYRVLETIREYAEELLAADEETEALRERHAEYYAEFLHAVYESLFGPREVEAGKRLAAEHENLLAAIGHAIDAGNADLALRLLRDESAGNQVGYVLLLPVERVLALPTTPEHHWYSYALALAAQHASLRGDVASTEAFIAQSLAAAEHLSAEPDWRARFPLAIARMGGAIAAGNHGDGAAHGERAGRIAPSRRRNLARRVPVRGRRRRVGLGGRHRRLGHPATTGTRLHVAPTAPTATPG
jgi:hypothetical protein